MIFGMGIGSVVLAVVSCCPLLGLPALGLAIVTAVLGSQDLKAMDRGAMDASGRDKTRSGQVMAFVGIGISVVFPILGALVYFFAALGGR